MHTAAGVVVQTGGIVGGDGDVSGFGEVGGDDGGDGCDAHNPHDCVHFLFMFVL